MDYALIIIGLLVMFLVVNILPGDITLFIIFGSIGGTLLAAYLQAKFNDRFLNKED